MKIKVDINMVKSATAPQMRAAANITIDGSFMAKGLKIVENKTNGKLRVLMPQDKIPVYNEKTKTWEDKYYDRFLPITPQARAALDQCVLGQYEKELAALGSAEAKSTEKAAPAYSEEVASEAKPLTEAPPDYGADFEDVPDFQ